MSSYLLHVTSSTDDELDAASVRTTSHLVADHQSVARCYTSPGAALWLLTRAPSELLTEQLRRVWDGAVSVELATVGEARALTRSGAGAA